MGTNRILQRCQYGGVSVAPGGLPKKQGTAVQKFNWRIGIMKFLGLAAVALTLTVSASAGTILNFCSGWSASAGGAIFFTAPIAIDSGTINCSAYGSLPVGDTFVSEQLVLLTDYSGGLGTTQNAIAATYSGT